MGSIRNFSKYIRSVQRIFGYSAFNNNYLTTINHNNLLASPTPLIVHTQERQYPIFTRKHDILNIGFEEFKALVEDDETVVIDVREKKELRKTGVIPGSINIPLGELSNALQIGPELFKYQYNADKPSCDTKIVFSCHTGKRSLQAAIIAKQLGFTKVVNFTGGWSMWKKEIDRIKEEKEGDKQVKTKRVEKKIKDSKK